MKTRHVLAQPRIITGARRKWMLRDVYPDGDNSVDVVKTRVHTHTRMWAHTCLRVFSFTLCYVGPDRNK